MSKTQKESPKNTNYQTFCRICLKTPHSRQLAPLFKKKDDLLPATTVFTIANIEIREDDLLPQQLCNFCWKRVQTTFLLIKEIQESDKWLRTKIFQDSIKTELIENDAESVVTEKVVNESQNIQNAIKEEEPLDIVEEPKEPTKKPRTQKVSSSEPRCCMCRYICTSEELLEKHVKDMHPDPKHKSIQTYKAVTCNYCYKGFQNNRSYTDHFRKPYVERVHQCSQCGQTFAYASDLSHHELIHIDTKDVICEICNKRFRAAKNLRRHMKIHDDKNKLQCDLCNGLFAEKKQLEYHIKSHINIRDCLCTVCGKGFVHNNLLKLHMRKHTGERPHKCDICNKAYKHNTDLRRHKYEHEGVKPFKCTFCERTFYQRSNMKVHERVHTGDMPFKCTLCGQKFKFHAHWKSHEKKHNERGTPVIVNWQ